MGGESIQAFAELPARSQYHRSEPCACGPTGRSAASDESFAPARSHAPRLQSCGLASVPPTGGSRHLRERSSKSGAAGIGTALFVTSITNEESTKTLSVPLQFHPSGRV